MADLSPVHSALKILYNIRPRYVTVLSIRVSIHNNMFYSPEILTKRGPLARVWMAATAGQTRVSRQWALDANIHRLCLLLLSGSSPMALRLKAHLLVGITRIYNKKCCIVERDWSILLVAMKPVASPTSLPKCKSKSRKRAHSTDQEEQDPGGRSLPDFEAETQAFQQDPLGPNLTAPEIGRGRLPRPSSDYRANEQQITLPINDLWASDPLDPLNGEHDAGLAKDNEETSIEMEVMFTATNSNDSPMDIGGNDSPDTQSPPQVLLADTSPHAMVIVSTPQTVQPPQSNGRARKKRARLGVDSESVLLSVDHLRQNLDVPDDILIPTTELRVKKSTTRAKQSLLDHPPISGPCISPVDLLWNTAVTIARRTEEQRHALSRDELVSLGSDNYSFSPADDTPPQLESPVARPEVARAPRDGLFDTITANDQDRFNSARQIVLSDRGSSQGSLGDSVPRMSFGPLDLSGSRASSRSSKRSSEGRISEGIAPGLSPIAEDEEIETRKMDLEELRPITSFDLNRPMEGVGIKAYKLLVLLRGLERPETDTLTNFNRLSQGTSRRVMAGVFFNVLALTQKGFVKVDQQMSYGAIMISKAARFSDVE